MHTGFLSGDLLGLESGGPEGLEDEEMNDDPRTPEQMDQSEGLGYAAQPREGTLTDLSAIPIGVSGHCSEDMDIIVPPSEQESRLGQLLYFLTVWLISFV